ncbi:uncharacterized protein LOC133191636 [Saccostrea echinata]|uniref:uncharacterized protein LOC133191636 n=1 Tax=Saccostrea echinata TaxID=191078 RepID=UPI002A818FD8|nr:uncharacterized protein LOC133191636 [Saccostrea echinata]
MNIKSAIYLLCLLHLNLGANEVAITSSGHRWPWDISQTLTIRGRKQCTRECQMRGSACLAVNYKAGSLLCEILGSTPNNLTELTVDVSYDYIAMFSQTSVFSSAVCDSECSSTAGYCLQLSSGVNYCRKKNPTCPTNYRFSAPLNFCYLVVTTPADFLTAKEHCESLHSRLAVLPTMEYIDYLRAERTGGFLSSLRYMVGGQWDMTAGQWRWLDGNLIFANIDISKCRITLNEGVIAWENKYGLMDISSTNQLEFLCEKVLH